ncbi:unnamed protein product [Leptosia nina]|uniref:Uncharacterized protein n=1 Tax=Leptosia nina TaxID=320188 RepID=A0AAV1JD73_9NEOP
MSAVIFLKSVLFATAMRQKKKRITQSKSQNTEKCRICNKNTGEIKIFDKKNHINIQEEINKISGVIINIYDKYSKYICPSCLELLQRCIIFREMCQANNKHSLKDVLVKKEKGKQPIEKVNCYDIPSPNYSDDNLDNWVCSKCNKDFLDQALLNIHDCTSLNSEPLKLERNSIFLCDICGKTAKSKASLLVHMTTHENIFPFKCDACPYKGRTMDLLRVHRRTHLTDKPYKCPQCPKTTTTASNLSRHINRIHTKTRPHKCTYCEKAFPSKTCVNKHIEEIHLRQATVECEICNKKFNTKKILQRHRRKIHKIKDVRHGRLPAYLQCQTEVTREPYNTT